MNKKIVVLLAVLVIALVSGSTYAYYTYTSASTAINFVVNNATITYNASGNLSKNLIPTASRTNTNNIIRTITVTPSGANTKFSLFLLLTTFPTTLKDASFKWAVYSGTTTLLTSGNFASATQGSTITLLSDVALTAGTTATYTLYIWIDGTLSNPSTMQSQTFLFNLNASATST